MFKRILSILLCSVLFIFSIIPASASPSGFVDILGFNPSVSSSVYLTSGATQTINFSLPDNISGSLFEILFKASGSVQVYANWGGKNYLCTQTSIDDSSLISYGFTTLDNSYRNSITLVVVNNSGSPVTFDCLSATLSPFLEGGRSLPSSYKFKQSSKPPLTGTFGSDTTSVVIGPSAIQLADRVFEGEITFSPDNWVGFDSLYFNFTITCANLSSVSAYVGGLSVPTEINMLDTGIGQLGMFNVSLVLDLTSIPVSSFNTQNLSIYFSGNGSANSSTIFLYRGAYGFFNLDSERSFFSYWFSQIGNFFTNLGSTISGAFSQWFGQLYNWISNLSSSISNLFSEWFTQLYNWISNFSASVSQGFDRVVNAILGDTPESDEMGEEAGEQGENLNNLNQQLNDYEKPDVGSMKTDIQIDPVGLGFISGGLGGIYQSSIFGQILTMIGILGLAGYVFFGKR